MVYTTVHSCNHGTNRGCASSATLLILRVRLVLPYLCPRHALNLCFQHLGQGANQAFEDVDLMIELLEKCNPSAASPPTATLESIFTEFEKTRIPRSATLVKQAREQGESRVVEGVENCIKRNAAYREIWKDRESVTERMSHMYDEQ